MLQGISLNIAGQFIDCCRAAQWMLQGNSVNVAGQISELCRAAQ